MNDENLHKISALLKSIAHPLRLKMLCSLQGGEMTVGELRGRLSTSHANISQHLTVMRNQGIIISRKEGNYIFNRIADDRIMKLVNKLELLFCA